MKLAVALLFCLSLLACNKKQEGNYGPTVEPDDIDAAISKALQGTHPQNLQVGEFASTLRTQEIYSGATPNRQLLEEEGITIIERQDFPDYIQLSLVREVIDHTQKPPLSNQFKDTYYLDKSERQSQQQNICAHCSYHNFLSRDEKVPRPTKVDEREPCPTNQDCRLSATHIFYDIVVRPPNEPESRQQIELLLSNEVPFFARILKSCITTVLSIENMRPLVRQCTSVYDYQWGSQNP